MERLDNLTRLFDEATFYRKLDIEIKRATRYGDDLSVLVFRPTFSSIEEQTSNLYPVLRILGEIVKESVRAVDIPCRLRGEIAIIFPNTPTTNLEPVVRRILKKLTEFLRRNDSDNYNLKSLRYLALGFPADFSSVESFRRAFEEKEWQEVLMKDLLADDTEK